MGAGANNTSKEAGIDKAGIELQNVPGTNIHAGAGEATKAASMLGGVNISCVKSRLCRTTT